MYVDALDIVCCYVCEELRILCGFQFYAVNSELCRCFEKMFVVDVVLCFL